MNRILAVIVSMCYVAGGLLTGYYAHALRLQSQASETGMDISMITDSLTANYAFIGPLLLVLAALVHWGQMRGTTKEVQKHVNSENALQNAVGANKAELELLKTQVAANGDLIKFCQDAIATAASKNNTLLNEDVVPAKDYAEPLT